MCASLVPASKRGKTKAKKKVEDKREDMTLLLKVAQMSPHYQESCSRTSLTLMAQLLAIYGNTYGFPELCAPVVMFLTKFKKRCKVCNLILVLIYRMRLLGR